MQQFSFSLEKENIILCKFLARQTDVQDGGALPSAAFKLHFFAGLRSAS